MAVAFFAPAVVFLTVVAPIWIFMHYRSKQKAQAALSEEEREELETLIERIEAMTGRIETLEAILDAETPGWRRRTDEAAR
ncbi:MAG: envelope stress response membrane protein PspB [Gammaproteobacteria bacterium]|nr:envelope stress response membrane protein PspB [Gammaproteobacteria bacterium]